MREQNAWCRIIEAITAPLGFFVLTLLIIESFLSIVLIGGNLQEANKMTGVYIGISLFIIVIIMVFVLVWFKPKNLTFDKESHLIDQGKASFGSDANIIPNRESLKPTETSKNKG